MDISVRTISLEDYNTISIDGRPTYRVNIKYAQPIYTQILKLVEEEGTTYALKILKVLSQNYLPTKIIPLKNRGRKLVCPRCGIKIYDLNRIKVPCPNKECNAILIPGENIK